MELSEELEASWPLLDQHQCKLRIDRKSLNEGEATDEAMIEKSFNAAKSEYNPIDQFRLGVKKPGKPRPIMIQMKLKIDKQEFMSKDRPVDHRRLYSGGTQDDQSLCGRIKKEKQYKTDGI